MSGHVEKRRVHVRRGQYFGLKGYAYFTDNQGEWDTITVRLDYVDVPAGKASTSALGAATSTRMRERWAYQPPAGVTETTRLHSQVVRIPVGDLKILSELEELAEVNLDNPFEAHRRLK